MGIEPALVEQAIELLGFTREGTIAEAANVPDDRWEYRPHPEARSFAELVRHIVGGTAMLVGEATDPEGDFQRRSPSEHEQAHGGALPEGLTPAELRSALSATYDSDVAKIRRAGAELLGEPIRRFDGGTWARLMYVFHAASHEDYHRGQLAMYARAMGLVPALTQRIHGTDAK